MRVLVLNAGSSSQKSCLYELPESGTGALWGAPPQPLWEGHIDWGSGQQRPAQGANNVRAQLSVKTHTGQTLQTTVQTGSRGDALAHLLSLLCQGPTQVIANLTQLEAVGHRVVHGGQDYQAPVRITPKVKAAIARLSALAPSHNPANLAGIELMEQLLQSANSTAPSPSTPAKPIPQVAVFDTAFHSQMPAHAATYPGPYEWVQQGIRRYGFHGISHQYCAQRAAQLLKRPLHDLKLIVCHLGNGASLSAIKGGRSIDTTMGFTPLAGLMMGTRSGSVDPGILIHLMRQGYSADELDTLLNKKAGLKGISGISHDFRDIEQAIAAHHPRAQLAKALYVHRLKACIGAMLMSLEGLDALVFTAGVGENSPSIRAATGEAMAFLGLAIDADKNVQATMDSDIATAASTVRALVIHTQEDWAIAAACHQLLRPPAQIN